MRRGIMGRRMSLEGDGTMSEKESIVRLWILRVLMDLKAWRKMGNDDLEEIVHALDNPTQAEDFELDAFSGADFEDDEQKRQKRQWHRELLRLHKAAERRADRCLIPDSLGHNVTRLRELVGLSETDCRILEFVVLLKNQPSLQSVARYLGDLTSAQVFHAVAMILDFPEAEICAAFGPKGMLARSALIRMDRDGSGELCHKFDFLTRAFAEHISEADVEPEQLLRGLIFPAAPAELSAADYPHLAYEWSLLSPYLRHALDIRGKGVNICLHGKPGTGKTQLVRTLAAELGCELFEVACEDEDGDPIQGGKRLNAFAAAQSFFSRRRALLVFDEMEDVFYSRSGFFLSSFFGNDSVASKSKGWINHRLEENPVPTLWISNSLDGVDRAAMRRFDMVIEMPVPPKSQRQRIARDTCGDLVDAAAIRCLAESEHLAPAIVTRAARVVRAVHEASGGQMEEKARSKALETLVNNTLEAQRHRALRQSDADRLPELYDLAFVSADANLESIAAGLDRRRCGRLCLYGPPGTGKTAYGRWLAERLDLPLTVKRASDLLSCWVGMTEQNIAAAFREAARAGSVLMIDEMDSFLQDRRDASRSWEVTQVNEMLTQMESFPGIFIASTNLVDRLDQAALRRFDLKAKFGFLASEQARSLFVRHCESLALPPPDESELRRVGALANLTPGDFAAVARQSGFNPPERPAQFAEWLARECGLKENSGERKIGF